jgi:hypothetical protein
MAINDRSKFNPNPCSPAEEQHNWRLMHTLFSRMQAMLEPTASDDGKLPIWNNTNHRWILVDPCVAAAGCGGSGGECASSGTWASGITPFQKKLTLGGSISATGCPDAGEILSGSPYTLTCNGGDQYVYIDGTFPCGVLAITLDILQTSATVNISIGAGTGAAVWTLSPLSDPFDYVADLNAAYTLTTNGSSQFDAASLTATIGTV